MEKDKKTEKHCKTYNEIQKTIESCDNPVDGNDYLAGIKYKKAAKHAYHTESTCEDNVKSTQKQKSSSSSFQKKKEKEETKKNVKEDQQKNKKKPNKK